MDVKCLGMTPQPQWSTHNHTAASRNNGEYRLPKLVLRTQAGTIINTDTAIQERLRKAWYDIMHRESSFGPNPWLLPCGPLPPRPDYTRGPAGTWARRKHMVPGETREKLVALADHGWPQFPLEQKWCKKDLETKLNQARMYGVQDKVIAQLNGVQRSPFQLTYLPFTDGAKLHHRSSVQMVDGPHWRHYGYDSNRGDGPHIDVVEEIRRLLREGAKNGDYSKFTHMLGDDADEEMTDDGSENQSSITYHEDEAYDAAHDTGYRAPKFFKTTPRPHRTTKAVDPFSHDRKFATPTGKKFEIKKSDKKATISKDPFTTDRTYDLPTGDGLDSALYTRQEAKPLEFSEVSHQTTKFRESRSRDNLQQIQTTMRDNAAVTQLSTVKQDGGLVQTQSHSNEKVNMSGAKKKVQFDKPASVLSVIDRHSLLPPRGTTPSATSAVDGDVAAEKDTSGDGDTDSGVQDVVSAAVDDTHGVAESASTVAVPADGKNRRPPPKTRRYLNPDDARQTRAQSKRTSSKDQMSATQDNSTLNYLSNYCLIQKDRLPYYVKVYKNAVANQRRRLSEMNLRPGSPDLIGDDVTSAPPLSPHDNAMVRDHALLSRAATRGRGTGITASEAEYKKLTYNQSSLHDRWNDVWNHIQSLEANRKTVIVNWAKMMYPQICDPHYGEKKSKGKKGKKKEYNKKIKDGEDQSSDEPELTPQEIIDRLGASKLREICSGKEILRIDADITLAKRKLAQIAIRLDELDKQRLLVSSFSKQNRTVEGIEGQEMAGNPEFRREQSKIFLDLHPEEDVLMNLEEVEGSLKAINNNLITEKECQFVYQILDLPGHPQINLQAFSAIAALSERVMKVEPLVRKLLNKLDFEALQLKADRCKELFYVLDEKSSAGLPSGKVSSDTLAVELAAGGLTPDHIKYVIGKLDRLHRGVVDFLDYLTYIPLFVEIHGRIVQDPLNNSREF